MPRTVVIVPAGMTSGRFADQPLAKILALPFIEHVRRRAVIARMADEVYVATPDQSIKETVETYGGKVLAIAAGQSFFERLKQAVIQLELNDDDVVIALSIHEPMFPLELLSELVKAVSLDGVAAANVLCGISDEHELQDKEVVKAVCDVNSNILYFSRAPIPHRRVKNYAQAFRHTGLTALTKEAVLKLAAVSPTPLEVTEGVDLMRAVESGRKVRAVIHQHRITSVRDKGDIAVLENILKKDYDQSRVYQAILNL